MNASINATPVHRQVGFTLTELMIAITIGLLILAGLTEIFVNNNATRVEIEKSNRQIENGRYAIQLISDDVRLAGFYDAFDPAVLAIPTAKPNPCASDIATLKQALPLHVQGYDNNLPTDVTCLSDRIADTDVLVVRRVSTCVAGSTGCDAVASNLPYFQASLCNNTSELDSSDANNFFALDTTNTANLNRHKRDCTTLANKRQVVTHIYYVANNDRPGDGIPTLKRAELGAVDAVPTVVSLVNGIENLQLEYGIDYLKDDGSAGNDGSPDAYTADPDSFNACASAACIENWKNVVSVKVNILSRNTDPTTGYTDNKIYSLGLDKDGHSIDVTPGDHYKHHSYQTVVRIDNPAGRRE